MPGVSESAVVYKLLRIVGSSQAIIAHLSRHSSAASVVEKKFWGVFTFTSLLNSLASTSVAVCTVAAGRPTVTSSMSGSGF